MNNKYEMEQNNIKFDDLIKVLISDSEIDIDDIDPTDVVISLSEIKKNNVEFLNTNKIAIDHDYLSEI